MISWKHLTSAGALCACLLSAHPTLAQDTDRYQLVHKLKMETGEQIDMPFITYTGYSDCYRAKKKVEIGRVIPRGVLVGADGRSRSATILSAKCVLLH